MKIKLWVDDLRPAPEGWIWVKDYITALLHISIHEIEEVALDHDLGDYDRNGKEYTGYDVLMIFVERKWAGQSVPEKFRLLTANPVGRQKMKEVIQKYFNENFR